MLFRKFHVVEDSEQDLEEIFPPMGFERSSVRLHDVKKNG